jgi:hypothetical protein
MMCHAEQVPLGLDGREQGSLIDAVRVVGRAGMRGTGPVSSSADSVRELHFGVSVARTGCSRASEEKQ